MRASFTQYGTGCASSKGVCTLDSANSPLVGGNIMITVRNASAADSAALMMAASSFFAKDRERVIRRLIECGARLDVQDAEGHTALMVAVITGSGFTRSVETLLELGADPHVRNAKGLTALDLAERVDFLAGIAQLLRAATSDGQR